MPKLWIAKIEIPRTHGPFPADPPTRSYTGVNDIKMCQILENYNYSIIKFHCVSLFDLIFQTSVLHELKVHVELHLFLNHYKFQISTIFWNCYHMLIRQILFTYCYWLNTFVRYCYCAIHVYVLCIIVVK